METARTSSPGRSGKSDTMGASSISNECKRASMAPATSDSSTRIETLWRIDRSEDDATSSESRGEPDSDLITVADMSDSRLVYSDFAALDDDVARCFHFHSSAGVYDYVLTFYGDGSVLLHRNTRISG